MFCNVLIIHLWSCSSLSANNSGSSSGSSTTSTKEIFSSHQTISLTPSVDSTKGNGTFECIQENNENLINLRWSQIQPTRIRDRWGLTTGIATRAAAVVPMVIYRVPGTYINSCIGYIYQFHLCIENTLFAVLRVKVISQAFFYLNILL